MNDRAQALVVSGFLGSGKTTLVRHLLEAGRREGIRTAVVSNEFGELGIDEALLASSEGDFVELAGGCVCCRLSDDLLRTLQDLWTRARPQRVIVETSGVALPYDTLINFWRDPVRAWAVDESSVVVVSAEQVACGRNLDSTFEDQVCAADFLVLSKADLVGDADARAAEAFLQRLQPGIPILRANFGQVDPRVFFPPSPGTRGAKPPKATHERAPHAHDAYRSEEIRFAPGASADRVRNDLERRAALRAKGFVQTDQGVRVVQGVAGRIELTVPTAAPPPGLVGRVVVIERNQPHGSDEPRVGNGEPA